MSDIKSFFSEQKPAHLVLLVFIFALAVGVRFVGLGTQMTHVDDIGVAWSTLIQVDNTYSIEYVRSRLNNPGAEAANTPQYKLLRSLDTSGKLETLLPYLKGAMKFAIVPQSFTYAPFQFLFTPLFISHTQTYESLIFWGRFPSFIFSVLALLLMVLAWVRMREKNVFLLSVTSLLLLGFSWENIIYARHMSSYAIGVFAGVALLYLLILAIEGRNATMARGILLGFLLALTSNMQYQIVYFIPAFFIAWFVDVVARKVSWKQIIAGGISYAIFMVPTAITLILPKAHLSGAAFLGTSYNFNIPENMGIFGTLSHAFNFFVQNGFKIVRFITMYVPEPNAYLNAIALVILAFCFFGLWRLIRSKNNIEKCIGLFFVLSLCITAVLAVRGRISLSPTRHALIYLPFLAFAVSYGVAECYEFLQKKIKFNAEFATALLISTLVLLPFVGSYTKVAAERKNQLNDGMMRGLIATYEPGAAIADDAHLDLYFLEPTKDWKAYQPGERIYSVFPNPDARNKSTYMLISQHTITNESCDKMLQSVVPKARCATSKTLYEYYSTTNAPLDIAREANSIYNTLSIKIIKL